jgi:ABC-type transport system involved in multi-copper enzyme maturation permease subunit
MVIVLLCQGLIFESNNPNDPAILFFGVIIVLILSGAVVGSLYFIFRRIVRNEKNILISKVGLSMLTQGAIAEVLQMYSSEWSMREGHLEIESKSFMERMHPVQLEELQTINSQVYKLGNLEYEAMAANARKHSSDNLFSSVSPSH